MKSFFAKMVVIAIFLIGGLSALDLALSPPGIQQAVLTGDAHLAIPEMRGTRSPTVIDHFKTWLGW